MIRTHAMITAAALLLALPACVRDVPGTSCTQNADCYLGETCQQGECSATPVGMMDMMGPPDAMRDLADDAKDMSVDLARDMRMDEPEDMKSDMISTMPDAGLTDMADINVMDMTDMGTQSGVIVENARLPGGRAAVVRSGEATPTFLAYSAQSQQGSLKLYHYNDAWQAVDIASGLKWDDADLSENAALFKDEEGGGLTVLFESYDIAGRSKLLLARVSPNWSVQTQTVYDVSSAEPIDFDYREEKAIIVREVSTVKHFKYEKKDGGSWKDEGSLTKGPFSKVRFVEDEEFMCGLTTTLQMLQCYKYKGAGAGDQVFVNKANVADFEICDETQIIMSQIDNVTVLSVEEDKKQLDIIPPGIMSSGLASGSAMSLALKSDGVCAMSYTGAQLSHTTGVRVGNSSSAPNTYQSGSVTSAAAAANTLHILGSESAGESRQDITYETHTY